LTSAEYTAAFNEVKDFGRIDSTVRTPEETEVARFWEGKAGTPQVPGYWNEIAESAALSQGNTLDQDARLFAELNVALADAIIGHFDAKYTYNRWRPITAIQLADQTGNPNTIADPNWLPLLNTPPNPSYVSGHGAASGAASTVLADFFGTDNVSFSLTSEDLKGVTHSFTSFSAAAAEAENSVVWSGIHFRFDVTAGHALGQAVAGFVDQNFFKPRADAVFQQTSIVSDVPGLAESTDHNLIDPLGLSVSPAGRLRVSDAGTGLSTAYDVNGNPHPTTVAIPLPPGGTGTAAPDGNVRNTTSGFVISANGRSAPAAILFATADGTIAAWDPQVDAHQALLEVDNSSAGAVYTGLALARNAQGEFLYAANFHGGTIDVFDSQFHPVQLAGSFTDPNLPAGFAPFDVKAIEGTLFVTYALQDPAKRDAVPGAGNGFIDEYDTNGNLIARFASQGALNAPHGLAVAPADFGAFSNALLVGNFGDGRINAFDRHTGRFLGQLSDAGGHPIANPGLWAIAFGNGAGGTRTNTLYFVAGINGGADGLLGSIGRASPGTANGDGARSSVDAGPGAGVGDPPPAPPGGAAAPSVPGPGASASGSAGTRLGQEDRDAAFALPGQAAQGKAARAQPAAPPALSTLGSGSSQVSAPVSEHQVPVSGGSVAVPLGGSTAGQPDPLTPADL
jgi:uncharacterized protein (TIGR03118 family)